MWLEIGINITIWQLFWSHLDLLQVLVLGCVPVVGNLWSMAFIWNSQNFSTKVAVDWNDILKMSKIWYVTGNDECCVFWPAFRCLQHLKAGRTNFFQLFSTFFVDFKPYAAMLNELVLYWTSREDTKDVQGGLCKVAVVRSWVFLIRDPSFNILYYELDDNIMNAMDFIWSHRKYKSLVTHTLLV